MNDPEDTEDTDDINDLEIVRSTGRTLGTDKFINSTSSHLALDAAAK